MSGEIIIFDPKTDIIVAPTWHSWLQEYLNIKRHILKKQTSINAVEQSLGIFERFMRGKEINVHTYGEFYQFMCRRKSKHYPKRVLGTTNAFLRYCEDSKYISRSPHWAFPVPEPGPSEDQRVITYYEYTRMLREAQGTIFKPVLITMWWTGFSPIDAVFFKKESVDMERLLIRSARSKTGTVSLIPFVAGSEIYHMLTHAMKGEGEYVNQGAADQGLLDFASVRVRLCKLVKKHAPGRTPKHFRNNMASRMCYSGVPEKIAMKIGGWKSPDIFKAYIPEDLEAMREWYDKAMKFQPKNGK